MHLIKMQISENPIIKGITISNFKLSYVLQILKRWL